MATVKITLEAHESQEDTEELLIKALTQHARGESHKEDFQDPAARDVMSKMSDNHAKMFDKMLREVIAVIEEDVKSG